MAKWTLVGLDTFENEYYKIHGEHDTEEQAHVAASLKLKEIERWQSTDTSGGQGFGGIQDKVFIIRPDGTRYRFIGEGDARLN